MQKKRLEDLLPLYLHLKYNAHVFHSDVPMIDYNRKSVVYSWISINQA